MLLDGFTVVLLVVSTSIGVLVMFRTGNVRFGSELRRGIVTVACVVLSVTVEAVVVVVDVVVREGKTRFFSPSSPPTSAVSFRRRLKLARKRLNR